MGSALLRRVICESGSLNKIKQATWIKLIKGFNDINKIMNNPLTRAATDFRPSKSTINAVRSLKDTGDITVIIIAPWHRINPIEAVSLARKY